MEFTEKAVVMTAGDMNRVLARMASQVVENNPELSNVLLVGIHRRGVPLAEKIAAKVMLPEFDETEQVLLVEPK